MASPGREQKEMNAPALLAFPFSVSPGPPTLKWYHPHLG